MVFCIDGLYLGVGPAHHFYGFNIFTNIGAGNFNTMATQIEYAAATGLFDVPKPVAMRAGMGFS